MWRTIAPELRAVHIPLLSVLIGMVGWTGMRGNFHTFSSSVYLAKPRVGGSDARFRCFYHILLLCIRMYNVRYKHENRVAIRKFKIITSISRNYVYGIFWTEKCVRKLKPNIRLLRYILFFCSPCGKRLTGNFSKCLYLAMFGSQPKNLFIDDFLVLMRIHPVSTDSTFSPTVKSWFLLEPARSVFQTFNTGILRLVPYFETLV